MRRFRKFYFPFQNCAPLELNLTWSFIELKEIKKIYNIGNQKINALDGVDLSINQGEFVVILGLEVLSFSDKKIKGIFIKQYWIAIMSIIIGLPLGYYLADWLFKTAIEEHYDFGANIKPLTYIIALVGTFLISYLVSNF